MLAGVDRAYRAWPDVTDGMRALRQNRLVVGFSNGDLDSLAALAMTNDLPWHVVLSTASARTFKPAEAAYRLVIDALSLDPARTLFVAAHTWDLRAAAKVGFRTAYLSRPLAEQPRANDQFDLRVENLLELETLLKASAADQRTASR
jgi:2-haloacid dehalogenase